MQQEGEHAAVIIGAGPAGLAAAYELAAHGRHPLVLEKADQVGGIARTEVYKGYRFDIGGHRFHTRNEEVRGLWHEMLGDDLLKVRRASRIYHQGRFFAYPLELLDILRNVGPLEGSLMLLSYLRAKLPPRRRDDSFEDWVVNRFGARLYRTFFQTYTEKVWGIPCSAIQAEWAQQRIGSLSLATAARSALFGGAGERTLISEFEYPRHGSGMMWQRYAEAMEVLGGRLMLGSEVTRLDLSGGRVVSVVVRQKTGPVDIRAESVISSMSLPHLVRGLTPAPPESVLRAAAGLTHRGLVVVALIVDRADLCPDQWIYVHEPSLRVGRIQNFNNWSAALAPDPRTTCIAMEYFCTEGDDFWTMPDERIIELAAAELARLGLAERSEVADGAVVRQSAAYPVYDRAYAGNLRTMRDFLATIPNLQTIGRNGMHRYNNMDHSMICGILAARKLLGQQADPWSADAEASYQEGRLAEPPARSRR